MRDRLLSCGRDISLRSTERERDGENEMKINCCSYVVLFLSSATKTSDDRRMVTDDHCYLSLMVRFQIGMKTKMMTIDALKKFCLLTYDYIVNLPPFHRQINICHHRNTSDNGMDDLEGMQQK